MKIKFNLISRYLAAGFMLIIAIGSFSSCSKDKDDEYGNGSGSGSPGANEVWMQSSSFNPGTRTVAVNTTVTWTNKDGTSHTVTSDNGSFTSSGNIGNGGTYSYKFTATGTYNYHCTIHSGMTGKVIVQ